MEVWKEVVDAVTIRGIWQCGFSVYGGGMVGRMMGSWWDGTVYRWVV